MDQILLAVLLILLMFVLLGLGVWVAITLGGLGVLALMLSGAAPPGPVLATTLWSSSTSWALVALPLFIWMGEILLRTRISEHMFDALAPLLTRLPGRLLHVNVYACGIFAAISGSSIATTVTIGKMTLPELRRYGHDERLALGTLAGSGTLGILIPPSIIMIVYGVAADVSIIRMFIAGVLPGLLLMALFSGYIAVRALANPGLAPPLAFDIDLLGGMRRLLRIFPVVLLIVGVIGSIYAGIATATEAAAVGVVGALAISAASGMLTPRSFWASVISATQTSCMIGFILAASNFLSIAVDYVGLAHLVAKGILALDLSTYELLAGLTVLFVLLGCFLDGISIVVISTSLLMVAIKQAGIDPVWFGIYLVIMCELSLITPPIGLNLFVLQGMTGRDILYISRAAGPMALLMLLGTGLLIAFPQIALYLPGRMLTR
ncbi:MAG: TRAP transporter large permease subunit [Thermodesulfobacteriota bacterium]|nr:TRAP transporter large permease subunit [Thermodesulfobacteriota bacterium]